MAVRLNLLRKHFRIFVNPEEDVDHTGKFMSLSYNVWVKQEKEEMRDLYELY